MQLQNEVVATLGVEFEEALHHISLDDIDWPAWRNVYLEGRSARAPVDRASALRPTPADPASAANKASTPSTPGKISTSHPHHSPKAE